MSVAETDLQKMISSYKEIMKEAEANKHRYLKIKVKARGKAGRRTFLNKEEWASLIFDKIGVAVEEVEGIDIPTGRRSWTEIKLKQGFNANKYECSIFDYKTKAGKVLDVKVGGSYDLSN